MLYPLKFKHYLVLIALIFSGYLFTITQKYYIPERLRPWTLLTAIILIFLGFFFYVKPEVPAKLGRSLSVMLAGAALILIAIQHLVVFHDLVALLPKLAVVFAAAVVSPLISGWIYQMMKR